MIHRASNLTGRLAAIALGLIVASGSKAITFEEIVSRLSVKDLAAFQSAPVSVRQAIADTSDAAKAWKAGGVPAIEAATVAADSIDRLTSHWSALAATSPRTQLVTHEVALLVLTTGVRELLVAAEWRVDGPLGEAIVGWLSATEQALRPRDGRPGEVTCFQDWWACMQGCSERATFMERSVCGMDCNLGLVGCVDEVMPGVGGSLGGIRTHLR